MNKNKTLLFVDDNPVNLTLLNKVFADKFEIKNAGSGREALDLLEQGLRPDLVLLDIMMPHLNGFETFEQIQKIAEMKNVPVIFLTADITRNIEKTAKAAGAADFLTKPYNQMFLQARVNTHLKMSEIRRQALSAR